MPTVHLAERALVDVAGADAEPVLQNILTPDLHSLAPGDAKPGALLTPQGKILFDFLISRSGENGFVLECRADVADDFIKRLTLYKLRAKMEISKREQDVVAVSWESDSDTSQTDSTASQTDSGRLADLRFPPEARVVRHYGDLRAEDADGGAWDALRVAHGVAESGPDYALGDVFPHDVLLDQNGGVGLTKGCYVGQEVVSRMHHRGTARRRVLLAHGDAALPEAGTVVTANDRPVGTLGTTVGGDGIAIVRIDRVKSALDAETPVLAGNVALTLVIPTWASFTFPGASARESESISGKHDA